MKLKKLAEMFDALAKSYPPNTEVVIFDWHEDNHFYIKDATVYPIPGEDRVEIELLLKEKEV